VPVTKANDWIKTVNEAAQWTIIEWRKDQSDTDKYYRIARLSDKYGDQLEQIRESLD